MDSTIFFNWKKYFVNGSGEISLEYRYPILTLDDFTAHVSFSTLNLLRAYKIVVAALPAHTSHRTQTLDYSVFFPFKIVSQRESTNDLFSLTVLISETTSTNFLSWFIVHTVMLLPIVT